VQQFTNDRDRLRKAIHIVTYGDYGKYAAQADALRSELVSLVRRSSAEGAQPPSGGGGPTTGAGVIGPAMVAAKLAQVSIDMLNFSETLGREEQSRERVYALLAVARGQRSLPGRKSVLYFSAGLYIAESTAEIFRAVVSEANRANVSFYSLDMTGLQGSSHMAAQRSLLSQAAVASQVAQQSSVGRAVGRGEVMVFDAARESIRANGQQSMQELAEGTGGFLAAETNDFRGPVQQIAEDVLTYYALAYRPTWTEFDGRFREISLKVLRPNVKVQARSDYFAVPPMEGKPVMAYEFPLLAALNTIPLPQVFDHRAGALHFAQQADGMQCALVVKVPMKNFVFVSDQKQKVARARFSLLALVKSPGGQILQRFSQDVPLEASQDKVEGFQKGNFFFNRTFAMAPGKYLLETVMIDRNSMKTSAQRTEFAVAPPSPGVSLSSVSTIWRVNSSTPEDKDADDPFRFQSGKVVPTLGEPVKSGAGAPLAFYFVVYPAKGLAERPQLTLEFYRDGDSIGQAPLELPAPDENGRIPYAAEIPAASFAPGQYEVRAIIRQGSSTAEERALFNIVP